MSESALAVDVRSVLLPLSEGMLLLPNAAVSEVIGYRAPDIVESDSEGVSWLLGMLSWRDLKVPLVSFERAIGLPQGDVGFRARIAICNTLNGSADIPFIAIQLKSAPHLVRANLESVAPLQSSKQGHDVILSCVSVNEQEVWIPNLDQLEQAIRGSS